MASLEIPISTLGDEPDIEELVARARRGGQGAFDALAARVRDRVRGWAARLTNDPDDAEDVAQVVLLRLHRQVREFEGRSRFTTWLYSVTKRVVLSRRARQRHRDALAAARPADVGSQAGAPQATEASLEETNRNSAHVAALMASCLGVLTGREREVFELGDLRGFDSSEIARRLDIKAVTVRTHLLRARRRIRLRMLEEYPHLLEDYRE